MNGSEGEDDNSEISSRRTSKNLVSNKKSEECETQDGDEAQAQLFLAEGNKHFIYKRVCAAIHSYDQGLKHFQTEEVDVEEEENCDLRVENEPKTKKKKALSEKNNLSSNNSPVYLELLTNRAACYLFIGNFTAALADTQEALLFSPSHFKAIYRQAKALSGLGQYQNAINFLQTFVNPRSKSKSSPLNKEQLKEIEQYVEKLRRMKQQSETGDFFHVHLLMEKTYEPAPPDWVDFISAQVKVECFPDRGRGLVATKDLPASKLILACRAFEIIFVDDGANLEENISEESKEALESGNFRVEEDTTLNLLARKIYDRLIRNPEKRWDFYKLHAGNDLGHLEPPADSSSCNPPELDMARIYGICRTNTFANTGDSYPEVEKSVGIWLFPAFVNHKCIGGNCTWKIFGDFIFVRTFRPIKKGEELMHSYVSPAFPLSARTEVLTKRLGFTCHCVLCELDRDLPQSVLDEKDKLKLLVQNQEVKFAQLELDSAKNGQDHAKNVQASILLLEQIISKLEKIQPKHGMYNSALLDPLQKLALKYFGLGEFQKTVQIMERACSLMKSCMLPHGVVDCSLWIVAAHLQMGSVKQAKKWGKVLKENLILAYGEVNVLRILGPWVIEPMTEWGLV